VSKSVTVPGVETLAQTLLRASVANALLRFREPAKMSELQEACHLPSLDTDLLRYTLGANSDLFISSERRWTLSIRYEDSRRPMHALIERVLRHAGQPVPLESLAYLLADVYHRTPEAMAMMVYRLSAEHFFRLPDNRVGLREWLLRTDYSTPEDVAFYNYVDLAEAQKLLRKHPKFDGSAESVIALLRTAGAPLSARFVAFLQWYRQPETFDAVKAYQSLINAEGLVALPLQENDALEPVTHWALAEWAPQWVEAIRPQARADGRRAGTVDGRAAGAIGRGRGRDGAARAAVPQGWSRQTNWRGGSLTLRRATPHTPTTCKPSSSPSSRMSGCYGWAVRGL
jgi:hypothetical protein